MSKLQKNQSGFSAVEAVLVLIVIVLIGIVGWFVYKNHTKAITPSTTVGSSATTKTTSTPVLLQPANIASADISQLVTGLYNKYTACGGDGTCEDNLVKQYGTTNLHSYYKPTTGSYGEDPIMCAQMLPDSIGRVSNLTTTPTSASGTITTNYQGTSSNQIKFTVVKDAGNLKIDTIVCNPALTPSSVGS